MKFNVVALTGKSFSYLPALANRSSTPKGGISFGRGVKGQVNNRFYLQHFGRIGYTRPE